MNPHKRLAEANHALATQTTNFTKALTKAMATPPQPQPVVATTSCTSSVCTTCCTCAGKKGGRK